MSSTDVFNFNMYFDSKDVYRRVQYMGNMAKGRDSSLSLDILYSPRERSVPYKLPDNETKLQLKEVSIYVSWILR